MNIQDYCELNNLEVTEIFEILPVELDFQNWFENIYWPETGSATGIDYWNNSENNVENFVYMMMAYFDFRLYNVYPNETLSEFLNNIEYSINDFIFESLVVLKYLGIVNIKNLMKIYQEILNNSINITYR